VASTAPDSGHHDAWDSIFRRRHVDLKHPVAGDPMLELAREITMLEDDIRRDGSITIKKPDVFGDGNLIASIQEYDKLMNPGANVTGFDKRFTETVQAYIARSDQGELHSATAIGMALGGGSVSGSKPSAEAIATVAIPGNLELLKTFVGTGISSANKGIGLEPTALDRQRSTFLLANQSLRRKMIGDDNSRSAGYGLYLFRVPVSVLPGRETTEGYSAIATLRAQLQVDQTHLRNTFPKMVIADLVESLAPRMLALWKHGQDSRNEIAKIAYDNKDPRFDLHLMKTASFERRKDHLKELTKKPKVPAGSGIGIKSSGLPPSNISVPSAVPYTSHNEIYGEDAIDTLLDTAIEHFETEPSVLVQNPPKAEEVKQFLCTMLEQTHNAMFENGTYETNAFTIADTGDALVKGQYQLVADQRTTWYASVIQNGLHWNFESASWLLALQSGILDRNLKKILRDLEAKGLVAAEHCGAQNDVLFYLPNNPQAVALWETIIRETFPLQVFNLDPIVEEQNAYDAFSRRREMQIALAFGVAKGNVLTADQKLKLSRKLSLDEATIALNRTSVAFAHGDDTFGWYFHPRIQTPPTESSNLGALARTIWSTGPTERYDRKRRRLEPGIRECEVLIAMPSFVTEVSFDVTTNWEKITRPGVTRRSYEEMVAQGGRIQRLRNCMQDPQNQGCYRSGDYGRLSSRIEQLEGMLGMQTYQVSLPYQYEQTGSGLFDSGKKQLRPSIDYFYGLTYLDIEQTIADMFITGRNFHPTLTHVIVAGSEQHGAAAATGTGEVEVISRELLRVRIVSNKNSPRPAEVRVATPAGMSNPILIPGKATPPSEPKEKKSEYDLVKSLTFSGSIGCKPGATDPCGKTLCLDNPVGPIRIAVKSGYPYSITSGLIRFDLELQRADSEPVSLGTTEPVLFDSLQLQPKAFLGVVAPLVERHLDFKVGDTIVSRGTLTFPGTSQNQIAMTSTISIQLGTEPCYSK